MEQTQHIPTVMLFRGGPWDGGAFYLEGENLPENIWIKLRVGMFGDEPCCREWICVPSLCYTQKEPFAVGPYRRLPDPAPTKRRIGVRFANGEAIFKEMEQAIYAWTNPPSGQPV
jgi:hypothetical protein